MGLLPFDSLPPHKPRRFVPAAVDLGNWAQIAPMFEQLEARAGQLNRPAELESWLLDWSELSAALDEESARRYIAMTCHTEDAEALLVLYPDIDRARVRSRVAELAALAEAPEMLGALDEMLKRV